MGKKKRTQAKKESDRDQQIDLSQVIEIEAITDDESSDSETHHRTPPVSTTPPDNPKSPLNDTIRTPPFAAPPTRPTTIGIGATRSWADRVQSEGDQSRFRNESIKVKQNPNFILEFDPDVLKEPELVFSNEDLEEGSSHWKHTLVGCVMGMEVSWLNM